MSSPNDCPEIASYALSAPVPIATPTIAAPATPAVAAAAPTSSAVAAAAAASVAAACAASAPRPTTLAAQAACDAACDAAICGAADAAAAPGIPAIPAVYVMAKAAPVSGAMIPFSLDGAFLIAASAGSIDSEATFNFSPTVRPVSLRTNSDSLL